ncbi:unnamed protein product [Orchesella dallaii]|uniref:Ribosomal RNA processing protein 1 B n=1 Tax=Orchesella dallaii TaxID=48710 RepID=A0ABP1QFF6_9HEXA
MASVIESPINHKRMLEGDGTKKEKSLKRKLMSENQAASPKMVTQDSSCMDGMSGAEMTMVRRLAGNDPIVRKKTLKKLKKWLSILAQSVPDNPECRSMIEPNFVRVWKALFYCMWMADKPLPQEQLAESISDLQNLFSSKTSPFLLFVEWFLRTLAREWNWIDRFRMDKFMMLFRRFLRKILLVVSEKKWHNDVLEGFLKIISTYIFNRYPAAKSKKEESKTHVVMAPLGLQIHFTDIFMEELAKVGGPKLKFQKILKILAPFIYELGYNNDERLLGEIRERIFNHLMRQSDVGIDYQEQLAYGGLEEVEEEEERNVEDDSNEDDEFLMNEADNDLEISEQNGPLDPRAGVDVILPQLDIDYEKLHEKLIAYGGQKDVKLKNRRILYSLASQFKEITQGKYPFEIPEDDSRKPAVPRKEIVNAAKRLLAIETDVTSGKRRKTKKERKREAKRRHSFDSAGSEDDSVYLKDEKILDHATDNYMSYLENEVEAKPTNNDVLEQENEEDEDTPENDHTDSAVKRKNKSPKKSGKKRKWKTVVEVEADEQTTGGSGDTPSPKKNELKDDTEKEEEIIIKRPKLSKRNSFAGIEQSTSTPLKVKGKNRRVSELLKTPTNKSISLNTSLTKSANKRVSFVLAKNLEHDHADYPVSIARSPAIPFDKDKTPSTCGLLKSPATPKSAMMKKRPSAMEFF